MTVTNFTFWQRWLFLLGIVVAAFGIGMALLNGTAVFDLLDKQINPVFWDQEPLPEPAEAFQGFIYGVLGATMAGWGVFIAFIAHHPFRKRERWAWNCLLAGMLVWYIVDTLISINAQVYFNAAFNTALLLLVGLPLVFSRKHFERGNR